MWWPMVSRLRQRQVQPVTGHSGCSANHSRRWAEWPPWRHVWHQAIHEANGCVLFSSRPVTHAEAALDEMDLLILVLGPPHDASGLPKCIMHTAQRGRGLRQLGHPLNWKQFCFKNEYFNHFSSTMCVIALKISYTLCHHFLNIIIV